MCSVVVFGRKKWMATELLVNASVLVINWVRVGRLLSFLQWTCRSKEAKKLFEYQGLWTKQEKKPDPCSWHPCLIQPEHSKQFCGSERLPGFNVLQ